MQLRECLHGGQLIPLCGLANLGEISPSLRNYIKTVCSYEK